MGYNSLYWLLPFVFLALSCAELPQPLCPIHCSCFAISDSGTAKCKELDVERQKFPRNIRWLTIENGASLNLTENIFAQLGLENLTVVKIHNTTVKNLDRNAFVGLEFLETVELVDTGLPLVHADTFAENHNLKKLSLAGNPLDATQVLPSTSHSFLASDSITELILSRCQLSQLAPQAFKKLTDLDFLDLSYNKLSSLSPSVFQGLEELEELNLAYNSLSELSEEVFADLYSLSSLQIQGNPLKTLVLPSLPNLSELDASECLLTTLSNTSFENVNGLTNLNLSRNSLYDVNNAFSMLPKLKYLSLSGNKLRGPLGDMLSENDQLQYLHLQDNAIETLGSSKLARELQWFTYLDLSGNRLQDLSPDFLHVMRYMTHLNVSRNRLGSIDPLAFMPLSSLKVLDLSFNELTTLESYVFVSNSELTKLYLNGNMLRHVSDKLMLPLKNLLHLDLSENLLRRLWNKSEAIILSKADSLSKVSFLNLRSNQITHLYTSSFLPLKSLRILNIENNPIECRPPLTKAVEWLADRRVTPALRKLPFDVMGSSGGVIVSDVRGDDIINIRRQWVPVVDSLCGRGAPHPVIIHQVHVPPIVGEPPLLTGAVAGDMWSRIAFVGCSLLLVAFAATNIILCFYARNRRQRPAAYGGLPHIFPGRSPAYQKLYEECSVPNPIVRSSKKLSVISAFTHSSNGPIQAV